MSDFDVVIVGAGLSGLSAAYFLAKEGFETLVLERGNYPGSKNVTGGRIYISPLKKLFGSLLDEAPLERKVTKEKITFLCPDDAVTLTTFSNKFKDKKYESYTILRAKFDRWLANVAEDAGATIIPNMKVDRPLIEGGVVKGVVVGSDELRTSAVIAADGVNSLITEKAGLKRKPEPYTLAVGVKEVIELPQKVIEDRFNIQDDEGVAQFFVGNGASQGLAGGGFLYTNMESLSIGVVIHIDSAMKYREGIWKILECFKQHREVAALIKDGHLVEYSAHLVPENPGIPSKLITDGMLVTGDAAGLVVNMGFTVKGMDYAMVSGYYAAKAIKYAADKGDFSAPTLAKYEEYLKNSYIWKDLKSFSKSHKILKNLRFYNYYPEIFCKSLRELYLFDDAGKERPSRTICNVLRKNIPIVTILRDLFNLWRCI